ncbi:hypothetical protein PROVRETT_07029 [Providencia rettgeri DSM 1131]|nr:hypothetical protein PROVRETT_07029 [Providencia rettgeri DSM 1131]
MSLAICHYTPRGKNMALDNQIAIKLYAVYHFIAQQHISERKILPI